MWRKIFNNNTRRTRWQIMFAISFFTAGLCNAQPQTNNLSAILQNDTLLARIGISQPKKLIPFYSALQFQPAWLDAPAHLDSAMALLELSEPLGLTRSTYRPDYFKSLAAASSPEGPCRAMLLADIQLTETILQFFHDLETGTQPPSLGYAGLSAKQDETAVTVRIATAAQQGQLRSLAYELGFALPETRLLADKINLITQRFNPTEGLEEKIGYTTGGASRATLIRRCYWLGLTDSIRALPDTSYLRLVKTAQQFFGLLADGKIRPSLITELNVSPTLRLEQLRRSLNDYRWLAFLSREEPVVVVNIPAARLRIHEKGSITLDMKMIVGKPSTPTPTLSSLITDVELYPYWVVPHSIIKKEWLPAMRRDPGYAEAGNFQVLDRNGKRKDPASIDWKQTSADNFPYIVRQSTGCDNALGLIKLHFQSPFGVYLHDTPDKTLFMMSQRFFSHGCMRMEEPMTLGRLLLGTKAIAIDTLTEKGCLQHQQPLLLPAERDLRLVVWYNLAGTDPQGRLQLYPDIYHKWASAKPAP